MSWTESKVGRFDSSLEIGVTSFLFFPNKAQEASNTKGLLHLLSNAGQMIYLSRKGQPGIKTIRRLDSL